MTLARTAASKIVDVFSLNSSVRASSPSTNAEMSSLTSIFRSSALIEAALVRLDSDASSSSSYPSSCSTIERAFMICSYFADNWSFFSPLAIS